MKKKKKIILLFFIFFVFVVLLIVYRVTYSGGIKTVYVSNISKLILKKGELVPNKAFIWNMDKEKFLSKVYGAETMKPDSEFYNEYRHSYQEEINITTFTPPIYYVVNDIPGKAQVGYFFDENGLYRCVYSWIYKGSDLEKSESVEKAVVTLADELNSSPYFIANTFEMPDLRHGIPAFPYRYQWPLNDQPDKYIEISILQVKYNFIVALAIER